MSGDPSSLDRGFLEDALHELNRKIGALVAETSLLQECLDDVRGEARRPAELLIEDVDRLRVFLHRLAAFVRPSGAGSQEGAREFDIVELCREVAARHAGDGPISLAVPEVETVTAPRRTVAEAIELLVDNALTHGGGMVELRIGSRPQQVVVEIADPGPGLPPVMEARPFDPFTASRAGLAGRGSGLGLALAHALLRSAGSVLAYTPGSPGARFHFSLDRSRSADSVTEP